ncbi:hypothetical protein HMI51_03325 [Corallococcus coralloides]|nr:hypothetical protein [Corallococcus coralloides]
MTPITYRCPVCGQHLAPLPGGFLACAGNHAAGPRRQDRNVYRPGRNGRLQQTKMGDVRSTYVPEPCE